MSDEYDEYVIKSLMTLMAQSERLLSESVAMREHLMALVANLCRVELEMQRLAKTGTACPVEVHT